MRLTTTNKQYVRRKKQQQLDLLLYIHAHRVHVHE